VGSNNAVEKGVSQIYSAISEEMTLMSGDNSLSIKFYDIFFSIRKCGALKKFTQSTLTRLCKYFIRHDPLSFDRSILILSRPSRDSLSLYDNLYNLCWGWQSHSFAEAA